MEKLPLAPGQYIRIQSEEHLLQIRKNVIDIGLKLINSEEDELDYYNNGWKVFLIRPNKKGRSGIFSGLGNKYDVDSQCEGFSKYEGDSIKYIENTFDTLSEIDDINVVLDKQTQIVINTPEELEELITFLNDKKRNVELKIQDGAYVQFIEEGKHRDENFKYPKYFKWLPAHKRFGLGQRSNSHGKSVQYNKELISHSPEFSKLKKEKQEFIKIIGEEKRKTEAAVKIGKEQLELIKKLEEEKKLLNEKIEKLSFKPTKAKAGKRGKAWDDVIISDLNYNILQASFTKKIPVNLEGPAGTGKSTIVRVLANDNKIPFVEFNFNGDTTVEHLLGHMVLVKDGATTVMQFIDGPLTDAVRNGKVFLGHEINATSPEVQFILNGLLENKGGELGTLSVQGNNGEVIVPHPNFRFYSTSNPGYLGTKSFGGSFASRFTRLYIQPLGEKEEVEFLLKIFPKNIIEIECLVKMGNTLRNNKQFTYPISTRDLIQILEYYLQGIELKDAISTVIYTQIDLEQEILEKLIVSLNKKEG